MDILKRFRMLDCKVMAKLMESKLKLLCDTSLEIVDAILYIKMIGSLMYLMNTIPNVFFAVNTLSQYMLS